MSIEITYHERAFLYDKEIEEDTQIPVFIESMKKTLRIASCIVIPCGSGQYIDFFEHSFEQAIFLDNDSNMIDLVKQKIISRKLKHIITDVADLREPSGYEADIVFVLNQALQLIPFCKLRDFIDNMSQSKYILLDLYDFKGCSNDLLSYYNIKKEDGIFYPTREFWYDNLKIIRYSMAKKKREGIEITYKYSAGKKTLFSKIFLYYYNFLDTIELINSSGKYWVREMYADYKANRYNGKNRFILLLERQRNYS